MKWDDMSLVQRVQAKLSQGKDAERFQKMEMQAGQKDMTKSADPSTNLGSDDAFEKRVPEELHLGPLTFNTKYIMNHLGLKKDERKEKEDDPMSVYDSSLLAGPSIKDKVHNHVRSKTGSSDDDKAENSGEAGSLDYAARNIPSMKQHMKAMNIGKKIPGKCKKEAFEEVKDEIKVAYFLAGLLKTAGEHLPDFEQNPDLLVSFLTGLTKSAGLDPKLAGLFGRLLGRTANAMPGADALSQNMTANMPWATTPPTGMNKNLVPPKPVADSIADHIAGRTRMTRAGQRADLARTGPGQ